MYHFNHWSHCNKYLILKHKDLFYFDHTGLGLVVFVLGLDLGLTMFWSGLINKPAHS